MSHHAHFDPARAAVLTIDLQNDFLHDAGAYGRAGQTGPGLADLPARVKPVIDGLRARGGVFVSAQFTLVPRPGGAEPLIAPHLKALRPFLTTGDFAPGSWGNAAVDLLQPPDYVIEKVTYSAFFQTRLDHVLRALGIEALIIGGIVTNGGVASTVRDAHVRGYGTILLSDGCGAFDPKVHEATLIALGSLTRIETCQSALRLRELA